MTVLNTVLHLHAAVLCEEELCAGDECIFYTSTCHLLPTNHEYLWLSPWFNFSSNIFLQQLKCVESPPQNPSPLSGGTSGRHLLPIAPTTPSQEGELSVEFHTKTSVESPQNPSPLSGGTSGRHLLPTAPTTPSQEDELSAEIDQDQCTAEIHHSQMRWLKSWKKVSATGFASSAI